MIWKLYFVHLKETNYRQLQYVPPDTIHHQYYLYLAFNIPNKLIDILDTIPIVFN